MIKKGKYITVILAGNITHVEFQKHFQIKVENLGHIG